MNRNNDHGFKKGKSCLICLIAISSQKDGLVNEKKAVDIVYLDISKAFQFVSCSIILSNLYGLKDSERDWKTENWLNCQSQSVVISTTKSCQRPVTSGVHYRLMLASVLFNILISDPNDRFDCILSRFADNTKLERMSDTPGRCAYHTCWMFLSMYRNTWWSKSRKGNEVLGRVKVTGQERMGGKWNTWNSIWALWRLSGTGTGCYDRL